MDPRARMYHRRMRRVRLFVTLKGAAPVLLSASVMSAQACDDDAPARTTSVGGQSGGGAGGAGGAGRGGDFNIGGGAGGWDSCHEVTVPDPGESVPADLAAICATPLDPTPQSHDTARVTLVRYSQAVELAKGFVQVDPVIGANVVGAPYIAVVDATFPDLAAMQISNVTATPNGYVFDAEFPELFDYEAIFDAYLRVRVSLRVDCGDPEPRLVEADTVIRLCDTDDGDVEWVSSGGDCRVCGFIAEMAPSPIVPGKLRDDLPLARALRLRVVPLAKLTGALVLFVEHDGDAEADVVWRATAGTIELLSPDIVVWRAPETATAEQIQVAVVAAEAAGVASLSAHCGQLIPGVVG